LKPRERVVVALSHQEPDRVPLDLGGCAASGMHASTVYALRQALKLDPVDTPIKVVEPYQMLGEIAPDLREVLGVDIVGLNSGTTMFGFKNEGWKTWRLFDGTPVLVPSKFNVEPDSRGNILMYPLGDRSVPPCARMPKNGFFFDAIDRQLPFKWNELRVEDNFEEFGIISEEELRFYKRETDYLYYQTDLAIIANFGGTSFGDIALVPGLNLISPRGIRGVKEWYICQTMRPDYVTKVFERQSDIALINLEKIHKMVGDRIIALWVTGTDFGMQFGPMISDVTYRKLFKPFHEKVNRWVHEHTGWKTFIHSCGAVEVFLKDFIDAGFDILNPVQTSAKGMEPATLKAKYGNRLVFWGGGVDTQKTLPFGTPEEVAKEVRGRVKAFGKGGGFIFTTVHNVQPKVPVQNVLAMYKTLKEVATYSAC